MKQHIAHVALVVREYDEAIEFFTGKLDFSLVVDEYQPAQNKRWVVVAPPGSTGTSVLLSRATSDEQRLAIVAFFCSCSQTTSIEITKGWSLEV